MQNVAKGLVDEYDYRVSLEVGVKFLGSTSQG